MENTKNRLENRNYERNQRLLQASYQAWMNGAEVRRNRERNKNFTYGNQWCDIVRDEMGQLTTEYDMLMSVGKEPITNNMMRQLVKSVVGRFRTMLKEEQREDSLAEVKEWNQVEELDSRSLEEFLISGICLQRIEPDYRDATKTRIDNVNMNRFFVNAMSDVRGRDCQIIGQLHDMSITELILRIARGDRKKASWLRRVYGTEGDGRIVDFTTKIGANSERGKDFWRGQDGKVRAIEVWTLESREVLKCHDRKTAQYYVCGDEEREREIILENKNREKYGEPTIDYDWDIEELWRCRWFSPMGDMLAQYDSPYKHGEHPFVMKFYPMTDGEVHSFVEDVIDQQKYVNRLITMIDHIMSASAKGVLLYPDTALPDGFTWEDIRRIWRSSNGILPYAADRAEGIPQQISTNATNIGAYEMLQMQMKLFEEISGVSGALQGRNIGGSAGAELYKKQVENGDIALADIYDTFNNFRKMRDDKAKNLCNNCVKFIYNA